MNEVEKRKLQGILQKIDALRKKVEGLLGDETINVKKKSEPSEEAKQIINSISSLSVGALEDKLNTLGHKDLGAVFVGVGGSSSDKRKPKAWLIERIMWLSKEFSEGHKSIRES